MSGGGNDQTDVDFVYFRPDQHGAATHTDWPTGINILMSSAFNVSPMDSFLFNFIYV